MKDDDFKFLVLALALALFVLSWWWMTPAIVAMIIVGVVYTGWMVHTRQGEKT